MIKLALAAALIVSAQPATGHCYKFWHFKTPQHCGVTRAASYHAPAPAKTYYVEITTPPQIPLPKVDAITEPEQRTNEQIRDQQEHDEAVAAHKDEINGLMFILHAKEDAKRAAGIE
jgi:hypothetical protein